MFKKRFDDLTRNQQVDLILSLEQLEVLPDIFVNNPEIEIVFTVNGIELDFFKVMDEMQERMATAIRRETAIPFIRAEIASDLRNRIVALLDEMQVSDDD